MGQGEMTLVFALDALRRFERPERVVTDAREWSEHVGVVADESPADVTAAIDAVGSTPDFVSGTGEAASSIASIRQRFPTDRHVYVGVDDAERVTVQALGWEYLRIEEAAEKAGWSLGD